MNKKEHLRQIRKRSVNIVPRKGAVSLYPGEWPSPFPGKGFEPMRFRDRELGDDPRRVHIPTSIRRGTPTVVERVALRDIRILVIADISPSMFVRNKADIALNASSILLNSALQARFSLAAKTEDALYAFSFGLGERHFHRLYDAAWRFFADKTEVANLRPLNLSRALPARSIVFYLSDFLLPSGEAQNIRGLLSMTRRYDFIPVIVQDELEYSFPILQKGSFVPLHNSESGEQEEIWISKKESAEIRQRNRERFSVISESLKRNGFLHLDDPDFSAIWRRFHKFFAQRR